MRRRSIRFRLTVWYAAILTAGLALFGGLIWLSLRHRLIGEVDRDLEGRASRFEKSGLKSTSETSPSMLPAASFATSCRNSARHSRPLAMST
jgi:hypothetical protein